MSRREAFGGAHRPFQTPQPVKRADIIAHVRDSRITGDAFAEAGTIRPVAENKDDLKGRSALFRSEDLFPFNELDNVRAGT